MKKILLVTAAVVATVIFFVLATLPPAPTRVDVSAANADLLRRTVAGAYHIHTTRSDGAEDKASVAAAAQRAGLQFAIFTDHGDATRVPDLPAYIGSVLCLDGVEISTNGGHYVALDMPASPYPLGGDAAAVVEDVARLGGFGIVAHPDSAKHELSWRDEGAPYDGIEWISIDTEWRDEWGAVLARAVAHSLVRPAPAIAALFDRPDATLRRWTRALKERPVVALAAADAHGASRGGEGARIGVSYEDSFRTLTNRVVLDRPLSGDAVVDGGLVMAAIRKGRVYTVVDAIASPAVFDFGTPPLWIGPPGSRLEQVAGEGNRGRYEVHVPDAPGTPPVPWLVANPATFVTATRATAAELPAGGSVLTGEWQIERDPTSQGSVKVSDHGVVLDYQLGPGPRANQFVALSLPLTGGVAARHIAFTGRSVAPMRASVQLRFADGSRWVKSVYLDVSDHQVAVPVAEMVAAEQGSGKMPDPASARSLLVVVDVVNAAPGTKGALTVSGVRLVT